MPFHEGIQTLNLPAVAGAAEQVGAFRDRRLDAQQARSDRQGFRAATPGILAGDEGAIQEGAALDPQATGQLIDMAGKMNASELAASKKRAVDISRLVLGVLNEPQQNRPDAYRAAIAQANQSGIDVSNLPTQYSPDLEPKLKVLGFQALDVGEFFKMVEDRKKLGAPIAGQDQQGNPIFARVPAGGGAAQTVEGILPPEDGSGTKNLSPNQMLEMGFPKDVVESGLVVQTKPNGNTNVVFKPSQNKDIRSRKIKVIESQLLKSGIDPEEALDRATNIADGNVRIEIVPGLGVAREINEITGEVHEVQLGQGESADVAVPGRTLFELAKSGAIAGIVPGAQELLGRTVGQIPGVPVATDVIQARQEMTAAQNGLIRALSINPRFPVGEINRLRKEVNIAPTALDSQRALISRMRGIHESLSIRLANEQEAAADPSLPQSTRAAAAQAVKDIGNFLDRLGIPESDDLPPEGVPEFSVRALTPDGKPGFTKDGKEVWESPDGRRFVVE